MMVWVRELTTAIRKSGVGGADLRNTVEGL